LGDLLAKIVFSAVWPARASFLERDFHRSHGSAVKAFNDHCRTSAKNSSIDEPLSSQFTGIGEGVLMSRKNFHVK
jgi:hypothetical protein